MRLLSAATKKALSTVHASMKECVAHLDGMGYDGADKADAADDISKADDTTITKLSTIHKPWTV